MLLICRPGYNIWANTWKREIIFILYRFGHYVVSIQYLSLHIVYLKVGINQVGHFGVESLGGHRWDTKVRSQDTETRKGGRNHMTIARELKQRQNKCKRPNLTTELLTAWSSLAVCICAVCICGNREHGEVWLCDVRERTSDHLPACHQRGILHHYCSDVSCDKWCHSLGAADDHAEESW